MPDNKSAILRAAAPKLPGPRKAAPVRMPAPAANKTTPAAAKEAAVAAIPVRQQAGPAPVVPVAVGPGDPNATATFVVVPVADPADQAKVDAIVERQYTAIKENLRNLAITKASQAAVEAKLKADGISLEDINAAHLADQHLADLETQVQEAAAKAKAKELFKAKYGKEFVS